MDVLPYELVEKIMTHMTLLQLKNVYIYSSKYQPKLSEHIKIVYMKLINPTKTYLSFIFDNISRIKTKSSYLNTILALHTLKIHCIYSLEMNNINYRNKLLESIEDRKLKRRFSNLTDCVVNKYLL